MNRRSAVEKLNIILIEDSVKQANAIIAGYEKAIKAMKDKGHLQAKLGLSEAVIEWMRGKEKARMRNDEQYIFYDNAIIKNIENKIKDNFYFVDKPCEKRIQGYPLDSISVIPEFNQYFLELTEEDKKRYKRKDNINNVIEFIIKNIL